MTDLPDISRSFKRHTELQGGLGDNITAALQAGEPILAEVKTNMGEAAVLTEHRLLLIRAGMMTAAIGKVFPFPLTDIIDAVLDETGLVKKFRVKSTQTFLPGHELTVQNDAANLKRVLEFQAVLSRRLDIVGRASAPVQTLSGHTTMAGKLGDAVRATLRPGEAVMREIQVIGEGLVVTDQRLLIVKGGHAAQAMFGQKVKSYPFDAITSVEVSCGALIGRIQITVPGSVEGAGRSSGPGSTGQMENVVQINRSLLPQAREIANFIEERMHEARQPKVIAIPVNLPQASVADELQKLAGLRDSGILTQTEFDAAKARLLGL